MTTDTAKVSLTANITSEYSDDYYRDQILPSLESGRIVLSHLWKHLQPRSVVDIGCGRGAWLKACHELGCTDLFGVDGHWNHQDKMIDPRIQFRGVDLNQCFALPEKVDLAISVEVAEHLERSAAGPFVDSLTNASDTVVFGAAYVQQNGPTHINEQRHSWWGRLFGDRGYVPFDLFRPIVWGDERVQFWYRQNTFLYVKQQSSPYLQLKAAGLSEMSDLPFLDCVHPHLYDLRRHDLGFRDHLQQLIPSFLRAVRTKRQR